MARLKAPQRREQLISVCHQAVRQVRLRCHHHRHHRQIRRCHRTHLYRHFGSKQELFIAITREVSDQTLRHWRDLIGPIDDPAEQLREIARQFPAHLKEMGDTYRVLHNRPHHQPRDRKVLAVLREHYHQMEAFFCTVIETGIERGDFGKVNPKTACWNLINTGLGYAMVTLNLAPFEMFDVEDAIEFILRAWPLKCA